VTIAAANLDPVMVGLIVVATGMAWGHDAGYAINPAGDFGPRLAARLTGYGTAWRDQWADLHFGIPITAPIIGALMGAALYDVFIGGTVALPTRKKTPSTEADETTISRERILTNV
jgi:glycerol uptake facilitator protein